MAYPKSFSLGVIFASATLTIMAGSIISPVLNLMRDSLGVAPSSAGSIITTHGLFMAVFSPLIGIIIDRMGAKRPYILALICYGLAGGSGLLINSFWALLASRACLGIALSVIFTAINVLILNMYEGNERDRVMGWRGTAQSFGGAIWPIIGGLLGAVSWHLPFAVYMLAIPIGLSAIVAIPELSARHQSEMDSDNNISAFMVLQENPVILIINFLMFTGNILLYAIVIFVPQLLEGFGITNTFHISLFITAMTTSAGITSFIYGKIRSRFTYRTIVTIATLFWSVVFTTISLAPNIIFIVIAVALFGICQGLLMPTIMAWIGEVVPPSFRGRFSSYLGTFGFFGQFLSPILFAPVLMLTDLRGIFTASAGIGIGWFIFLSARKRKVTEQNSRYEE
jgi:ACDE family multidrug resistance protein